MENRDIYKIVNAIVQTTEASHFQDFCDRFLLKKFPEDYIPVRAGGPLGDMKNDGYCCMKRKFFQAHASRGEKISNIKNKIEKDFNGCLAIQRDVQEFIYLTNDTQVGEVAKFIDELQALHADIKIYTWGPKKIAEFIGELGIDAAEFILDVKLREIQYLEQAGVEEKDRGIIDEIFNFIYTKLDKKERTERINYSIGKLKKISLKIEINFDESKRERVKDILTNHWVRKKIVEGFIEKQIEIEENRVLALKDKIQEDYCRIRKCDATTEPIKDFSIFESMALEILDESKKTNPDYLGNAKAIILYFFEFCDIGEKTDKEKKQKKQF